MKKHTLQKIMRNRQEGAEAVVTYTELLFDLIYVFAVTQLSHYLLHHPNLSGLIQSTVLWFGVWLLWQHTVWVTNWFNADTRPIRLMIVAIMVVSLFMTSALPEAFGDRSILFACCYVAIQIGRTIAVLFMVGNEHAISNNYKRILFWMTLSGIFWLAGAFMPPSLRLFFWLAGVLIDYLSAMIRFYTPGLGYSHSREEWTINGELLLERCKLFVIIAFGETILMTGVTLSETAVWSAEKIVAGVVSFLTSVTMWWIYFEISDEVTTSSIKKSKNPGSLGLTYNAIHVVLIGAIILCAVGDEMVVREPLGIMNSMSLLLLVIGPVIYIASNMLLHWVTCHTFFRSHLIAILVLLALLPFAFVLDTLWTNACVLIILSGVAIYEAFSGKSQEKHQDLTLLQ